MFKTLNPFRVAPAREQAKLELEQAERQLLDAQSANEYASALVLYHTQRINRLRKVLDSAPRSA